MKKIYLSLLCAVFLAGCGGADSETTTENSINPETSTNNVIELSVQNLVWQMSIPKTWERMDSFPDKDILFLSRNGSQNIAISEEQGFTPNIQERLLKTLTSNLSLVEIVSQGEDIFVFRGKLTAMTPLREFYQRAVPVVGTSDFLLLSCSQEVNNLATLDCVSILNSFVAKNQ